MNIVPAAVRRLFKVAEENPESSTCLHCYACGHTWFRRQMKTPRRCPSCQSRTWYIPRDLTDAGAQKELMLEAGENLGIFPKEQ